MFQKPKFKLVCTADYQDYKVGDIVTTADMPTHFGGPWGWIQDAGCAEWQENLPTLEEVKADKKAEINSAKDFAEAATPFIYLDKPFDYDSLSRERLNVAIQLAQSMKIAGVPGDAMVTGWKLANNELMEMTVDALCNMPQAFAVKSAQLHEKAWGLKAQIDAAKTIDEVRAIVWN